jgi:Zn-dependent protease
LRNGETLMQLPNYNTASGERPPIGGTIVLMAAVAGLVAFYAHRTGSLSTETFISLLVLIPSVILHEISHGWLANAFGDPTARRAGRLTLNPLRHVDPLGTFIVPGVLLLTGAGVAFGWAKPVPVNVSGMSRNKALFVALVGPFTNIVLCVIAAGLVHIAYNSDHISFSRDAYYWTIFTLVAWGRVNVVLAVYNLLPIPPLDGSSIIERFLPQKYMYAYLQFRKYSILLLLVLMLAYSRVLAYVFDPAIRLWAHLLPGA